MSGDKAVSEKKALQIMSRIARQSDGWVNPFMIGVKYWNGTHPKRKGKPHKANKKKIMVKEGNLKEAPKPIHHSDMRMLYVPKKDIKNAIKLLRLNIKHGNVEVEKKPSPKVKGHYRLITTKKMFDDVVSHLAMKNIGVKTIAKGKM